MIFSIIKVDYYQKLVVYSQYCVVQLKDLSCHSVAVQRGLKISYIEASFLFFNVQPAKGGVMMDPV